MSKKWESRQVITEVRPNLEGPKQDGLPRQFWARVVNYDVVDDYGTKFKPGCFSDSLQRRLPRLMYGHAGWENPAALLGRGIDYRDAKDGLDVLFEFDDFEYVPAARQIAYQMSNDPTHPTLDQFSIGFARQADTRDPSDGKVGITRARLGETSVVVEGSVPGTKLLAFRASAQGATIDAGVISANVAASIIARFSLGELDLEQALREIKSAVVVESDDPELDPEPEPEPEPAPETETEPTPEPDPEPTISDEELVALEAELADVDSVLADARVAPRE